MKNSVNKVLVAAVVILLLANVAMVIMMIRNKNKVETKRSRTGPLEMMAKEVGMSDQQQKDYQKMRDDHMKDMRPLFDSLRAAKTAYFSLAKSPTNSDSELITSHKKIEGIEMAVDKSMLQHFRSVRAIFDTAQQRKFDDFVQKMMQRGPGGRKKDSTAKER